MKFSTNNRTNVPVLFTTYNRLDFTKKSLQALVDSDCGEILIYDNASTDGTVDWVTEFIIKQKDKSNRNITLLCSLKNTGISGAMNWFIGQTKYLYDYLSKVDNDTIVPPDWSSKLESALRNNQRVDILQAKHPILKATHPLGFDAWMKTLKQDTEDKSIYYNHFVGGSGIMFRRTATYSGNIPDTGWMLGGWREFQKRNPQLIKAFTTDVEIKLLDMNEEGGSNYPTEYTDYYKETKRL